MRRINIMTAGIIAIICNLVIYPASSSQALMNYASSSSSSVLRFQQKLAQKGNPEAQYKLATMYEMGTGVEIDFKQARVWYNKAAYQNFKPAKNRLIYLDIKQSGFKASHNYWLKDLKHDAKYGDGEALFLLGQMYAHGTGIEKDNTKAIRILKKAVTKNISGAENELAQAEKSYSEEKQKQAQLEQQKQRQQAKLNAQHEQQRRQAQQRLIKNKRLHAEQKVIEQQRQLFSESYKQIKTDTRKIEKPANNPVIPMNDPATSKPEHPVCSGKNRFAPTCR